MRWLPGTYYQCYYLIFNFRNRCFLPRVRSSQELWHTMGKIDLVENISDVDALETLVLLCNFQPSLGSDYFNITTLMASSRDTSSVTASCGAVLAKSNTLWLYYQCHQVSTCSHLIRPECETAWYWVSASGRLGKRAPTTSFRASRQATTYWQE